MSSASQISEKLSFRFVFSLQSQLTKRTVNRLAALLESTCITNALHVDSYSFQCHDFCSLQTFQFIPKAMTTLQPILSKTLFHVRISVLLENIDAFRKTFCRIPLSCSIFLKKENYLIPVNFHSIQILNSFTNFDVQFYTYIQTNRTFIFLSTSLKSSL